MIIASQAVDEIISRSRPWLSGRRSCRRNDVIACCARDDISGKIQLRLDAGAAGIAERAGIIGPAHHEAAIRQAGDGWLVLAILGLRVDAELAANLRARRSEHLRLDAGPAGVAERAGIIGPAHHEAAIRQAGDGGLVLVTRCLRVDAELAANLRARRSEHLRLDAGAAGVAERARIIGPAHHKAAICQAGDGWLVLVIRSLRVDEELAANPRARRSEHLRLDAGPAGVAERAGRIPPAHHKAAIRQAGDGWLRLVTRCLRVDEDLAADLCARRIEHLCLDAGAAGVAERAGKIGPAHHEAAICQAGDGWLVLVIRCLSVDAELAANLRARRSEHLCLDAGAAVVAERAGKIGPAHHEAAICQACDGWLVLDIRSLSVDEDLAAELFARRIEHLRLDAGAAGVAERAGNIPPAHHEAAIRQAGDGWLVLVIRCLRVDEELGPRFAEVQFHEQSHPT